MRCTLCGIILLLVLLSSCTSAAEPTANPTPADREMTSTLPPPMPTADTPDATPALPGARTGGIAGFRDQFAVADQFFLSIASLPAPPIGHVYQTWLFGNDNSIVSMGILPIAPDGSATLTWGAPSGENLLRRYVKFQITLEPEAGSSQPAGTSVVQGDLDDAVLANAQRLLVANRREPATPRDTAYALGLRAETNLAVQHIQNALNAAAIGAHVEMRAHLEHIVNILEGIGGPRYGDHDGNGAAENPGDGFGVIGYARAIATILAAQPGVTEATARIEAQSAAVQERCLSILTLNDTATVAAQLSEAKQVIDQLQNEPVAQLYQVVQDSIRFALTSVEGDDRHGTHARTQSEAIYRQGLAGIPFQPALEDRRADAVALSGASAGRSSDRPLGNDDATGQLFRTAG